VPVILIVIGVLLEALSEKVVTSQNFIAKLLKVQLFTATKKDEADWQSDVRSPGPFNSQKEAISLPYTRCHRLVQVTFTVVPTGSVLTSSQSQLLPSL